jgi:hypothetical protein
MKTKNFLTQQVDLNFNLINTLSPNSFITLIHNKNKIQLSISDIIRIINASLSHNDYFFTESKLIKNPWDNKNISLSNLYNIFLYIQKSNYNMPILFLRFFQSNFNILHFENNNQFLIRDYIIKNSMSLHNNSKLYYISTMLDTYNSIIDINHYIDIDDNFPSKTIIDSMKQFIKPYLLSIYSYESNIRDINKIKMISLLTQFKKENPLFGRKIISNNIKKIYYISRLKYESKTMIFIPCKYYIPTPNNISLIDNSYFIGIIPVNNYSIFNVFDKKHTYKYNNNYNIISNDILDNVSFTKEQQNIIDSQYTLI